MTGNRTTKGQRAEVLVDVGLAIATGVTGLLLVGFILLAWQNGAGWVVLPILAVAGLVIWACTYEARGSDTYPPIHREG